MAERGGNSQESLPLVEGGLIGNDMGFSGRKHECSIVSQ